MNCKRCGKLIPINETTCKYCGTKDHDQKSKDDPINERLRQIDELIFGNSYGQELYNQTILNLEQTIKQLEERLNSDKSNQDKILNTIANIDDILQNKYPLRQEIIEKDDTTSDKKTTSSTIHDLLDQNPPETNLAAYKIRSSIEKQLKDYHKLPYVKQVGFVKSINDNGTYEPFSSAWERYSEVTKTKEDAKALSNQYRYLNKFIHDSEENDEIIRSKFLSIKDQIKYLKETLELFKKHNLIWE